MKKLCLALLFLLCYVAVAFAQPAPPAGPFRQNGPSIYPVDPSTCLTFPASVTGGCMGAGTWNVQGLFVGGGSVLSAALPAAKIWVGSVANVATPQNMSGDCTASIGLVVLCRAPLPVASKTASYAVQSGDSKTVFSNAGATGEVDFTLPSASAGLIYSFAVETSQTLKVIAGASATIAIGNNASATAGNITSSFPYSVVTLVAISSTEWVALSSLGSWTVN